MINNIKTFITDNKKDLLYILALSIFLLIITIPKLYAQYNIGIGNWDTYLYLENGRVFAKMGWGDVPSIAPVLPIILSKMFLIAGHTYKEAIFNIDAVFYIIGILSFYLLLRLKFNENISFIGSVIFSTFTLLYSWVAIGGNDIIGVTGTILTVYLFIIAHKFNHKWYLLAFPIAAYAFLSRYTAGVMIFTLLFYLIINRVNLHEIKHIIVGGILGVISVSWFLYQFYIHLGTAFPFLGQFSGTVSNTVVLDSGFLPDSWYYINHLPNYLMSYVPNVDTFNAIVNPMGNMPSIIAYAYILLFLLGFILLFYKLYDAVKSSKHELNGISKIGIGLSLVLFIIFLFTLGSISYIFSSVIFLIILFIYWKVLEPYDIKDLDYELVMISLFVTYLIFQSILFTKNDRYFITVLPFIAYFITYAIDSLFTYLSKYEHGIKLRKIATVVIVLALLFNTLLFVGEIPTRNDYEDIGDACEWLFENRHINNTTYVHSDNWPAVTWYLNIYAQRGVINTSNVSARVKFAEEILTYSPEHQPSSYYLDTTSSVKYDYPGLNLIKQVGSVGIYENKYLNKGYDYLRTEDYNNKLRNDINEYNRTHDNYV
ncbi:MAG: glycosyltransferase family 39 protein [Methanosphaera sp.]|uniref:glycosyltransferase family 39 protein n=1 Tax=Methanosphaera sp. ISO3-F5 TaxID=1452353 RepID=UPI002B25FC8B|nr:glycosyltransferase family 39 protein [Methanosphaera sp. ISO3-F5]MBR0473002.1 glycosyltransferase family 39 protein [Methanosphaera sp.]WQH63333.1 glycosyltransferase family 39 protein [Methanosphaera sp. ISO3-F5]